MLAESVIPVKETIEEICHLILSRNGPILRWVWMEARRIDKIVKKGQRSSGVVQGQKQMQRTFEEYFKDYYYPALKYAEAWVSNFEVVEDLVMDAFINCYINFEHYNPERASFATWFFAILRNRIKNHFRNHKTIDFLEDYAGCVTEYDDEVFENVCMGELRTLLWQVLNELPDMQRKIIVLKYFRNRTSKEIATECGMTPGNVRVQLSRVMKVLRGVMKEVV